MKKLSAADLSILADRLYEASIVPELWPDALEDMCVATKSFGGVLFEINSPRTRWVASPRLAPLYGGYLKEGWAERNPRSARALQKNLKGFVGDYDLFTPEEMDADPTYGYFRRQGFGWCGGMLATLPCNEVIVFVWERLYQDGPFARAELESLNGIAGHLSRAALLAARLGLEKARAAVETMRALGLPAAVLSHADRLLLANDLFDRFIPSLFQDSHNRLTLPDPRADALLDQALGHCRGGGPAGVQSLPIAAKGDRPPLVLHAVPIRGAARDIFSAASCMLVIAPLAKDARPDATLLQGLFDLTPAEARVAQAISGGGRIQQIALDNRVSPETVRTQLKSILAKTGTSRQAELVRLLSGATLP